MKHIPYSRQWIDEDDIKAVTDVLRSDMLTQGKRIELFEEALCETIGVSHAIVVSNGTAALHLLCHSLELTSEDMGVTSPITFAASANGVIIAGGQITFNDVDPQTGLLIPTDSNKNSRVCIPVSLNGRVPALDAFQNKHSFIIEDAAHSLGATYEVKHKTYSSGSCQHTDAAILSFHPVKHICTGEGGAILTNDAALAEQLKSLRSHCITRKPQEGAAWFYDQEALGFNYRMTDIQAALGLSQLKKLPHFLSRRREIAQKYCHAFNDSLFKNAFRCDLFEKGHAYHLFPIHWKSSELRNRAQAFLTSKGIGSQVHYKPLYQHTYYREKLGPMSLPGAEAYYQGCLSIPLYPKLEEEEQSYVIASIADFCKSL